MIPNQPPSIFVHCITFLCLELVYIIVVRIVSVQLSYCLAYLHNHDCDIQGVIYPCYRCRNVVLIWKVSLYFLYVILLLSIFPPIYSTFIRSPQAQCICWYCVISLPRRILKYSGMFLASHFLFAGIHIIMEHNNAAGNLPVSKQEQIIHQAVKKIYAPAK